MSYSKHIVHIGFATKKRRRLLEPEFDERMRNAASKRMEIRKSRVVAFGCWYDHVHILLSLSPSYSIVDAVVELKDVLALSLRPDVEVKWQDGYWAFSVSARTPQQLIRYVNEQRARHEARLNFDDELEAYAKIA